MLSKCSNPSCTASFRYLHTGKLYRFDARDGLAAIKPATRNASLGVEFFWLCEACAATFTVVSDCTHGTRVVLRQPQAMGAAAGL